MATRELTITLNLPDEVSEQLAEGDIDAVSQFADEAIRQQVRDAAIHGYLSECEAAGHPALTSSDLNEFRRMVGEEAG